MSPNGCHCYNLRLTCRTCRRPYRRTMRYPECEHHGDNRRNSHVCPLCDAVDHPGIKLRDRKPVVMTPKKECGCQRVKIECDTCYKDFYRDFYHPHCEEHGNLPDPEPRCGSCKAVAGDLISYYHGVSQRGMSHCVKDAVVITTIPPGGDTDKK